jgi:ubiquinone/menaquinone biosynthesis C-methylase UbiE
MITTKELEELLVCPVTQRNLSWLTPEEMMVLNQRISQGLIHQQDGAIYRQALTQALKIQNIDAYFPIVDGICYLLADSMLAAKETELQGIVKNTKTDVKKFYDEFGWKIEDGVYQDAKDSEDLRDVSQDYILQCHLRLNQHLPHQGKYLLDVACGPIQYPAYLTYSENFQYRICADISLRALKEAQKKLNHKGIYILCDVTRLPIRSNQVDALVSLHTLYHVPANEQSRGFAELHRVLKPGGKSVVVYSWGSRSVLMNMLLLPQKAFSLLKRKLFKARSSCGLYFHAHTYEWFKQEVQAKYQTQLYSWRAVNVPFLKYYVHESFGGLYILKLIFWLETRFAELMGRIGAYPLFVSVKK